MENHSAGKKKRRKVKLAEVHAEDYQDAGPAKDVLPLPNTPQAPSATPQAEPEQDLELLDGGPAPAPPST